MKRIMQILWMVVCLVMLSACGEWSVFPEKSDKKTVEEYLGIDLAMAQVLDEWENHGWFGDGETFVKLSVPDGFERDLGLVEVSDGKYKDGWYALPLMGTAYEYFYEWGGLFEHPETGERVIPEIANGYWKLTVTGAQNWELVILDTDADILYYYEYDS